VLRSSLEELLTYLRQRTHENWLIAYDNNQFCDLTEEFFVEFTQLSYQVIYPKIVLVEENPLRFLAAFLAAVAANCYVFLCNPQWKKKEWEQVFTLVQPDLILGSCLEEIRPTKIAAPSPSPLAPLPLVMIPTGGSSGKIRFAMHSWKTLTESVRGFYQYFGEIPVSSYCVLPLYHTSGLMQFLRSFLTGGKLLLLPYQALKSGEKGGINPEEFFISLVPTQLQFLLHTDPSWLSRFHTVLLGGAAAWPLLLDTARKSKIRLAPTYGMTETASQIVTLKPEDFLKGNNSSGQILPHIEVTIRPDPEFFFEPDQAGIITVRSNSLCLGYYPELFPDRQFFQTNDLGFFDDRGYLHITGRNDRRIITGGENVFPIEVEAVILATQLVIDVCVIGLPDQKWGQAVTAVYSPQEIDISIEAIKTAIENKISKFKQPKHWIQLEIIPRNLQGKVNYPLLKEIATAKLSEQTRFS
jgi:O-succinylbenzoic acid--CoA ligase